MDGGAGEIEAAPGRALVASRAPAGFDERCAITVYATAPIWPGAVH